MDINARSRWTAFARAKDIMMEHTSIPEAPWWVVDSDRKRNAHLNTISHLLGQVHYEAISYPEVELPSRVVDEGYQRPPFDHQNWIPQIY
jgi:hypothetical protein